MGCNVNKCTSSGSCTPDPRGDERRGDEDEGGDGDDGDGDDEDGEGEGEEEKNMMGGLFSCCASPGH